jgi:UDP-4-amino-4,6-dideoxy-N-acetyl-beta-L-altrosamine N-acetyltransferase
MKNQLTYRPLQKKDLELRFKWLNNPETNQFLGSRMRKGTDFEFHQKWFSDYENDKRRKIFIIELDEKPIGQVGLTDIDLLDKNACVYIVIGEKDCRGKGIGTESVKFILKYGFEDLKLHKIWLDYHDDNIAGRKCYDKCGFIEEGRCREQILKGGKYVDEIIMGITEDEYKKSH